MRHIQPTQAHARRQFLQTMGAACAGLVLSESAGLAAPDARPGGKRLWGIFPIAQTPFTSSNKFDVDTLVEELKFIDRGGVHGFVWPQLASEWDTLSEEERLAGAEAIATSGKKLRPAIVLGVQAANPQTAQKYAEHAAKVGADAIISLPPAKVSDPEALLAYYKSVGSVSSLPMFVQAVGSMSVDTILRMSQEIPTLRYVKDEAGQPLMRIQEFRSKGKDELKIFTGGHGKTLIDEMIRGFSGSMPAASFADVYATAWDQWHSGRQKEAIATFGNAAILINEVTSYADGMKYILHLRGVFKTYGLRNQEGFPGQSRTLLDDKGKEAVHKMIELMKASFRA